MITLSSFHSSIPLLQSHKEDCHFISPIQNGRRRKSYVDRDNRRHLEISRDSYNKPPSSISNKPDKEASSLWETDRSTRNERRGRKTKFESSTTIKTKAHLEELCQRRISSRVGLHSVHADVKHERFVSEMLNTTRCLFIGAYGSIFDR